jgi:hypothetical protein
MTNEPASESEDAERAILQSADDLAELHCNGFAGWCTILIWAYLNTYVQMYLGKLYSNKSQSLEPAKGYV